MDNSGITERDGELLKILRVGPEHVVVRILSAGGTLENAKSFSFLFKELLGINIKESRIFWCL